MKTLLLKYLQFVYELTKILCIPLIILSFFLINLQISYSCFSLNTSYSDIDGRLISILEKTDINDYHTISFPSSEISLSSGIRLLNFTLSEVLFSNFKKIIKESYNFFTQNAHTLILLFCLFLSLLALLNMHFFYRKKLKKGSIETLTLVTQAGLQNIKNRISPHFFFNTLNGIMLPLSNYPKEKKAFDRLVQLLRLCMENCEKTVLSVEDEIKLVDRYIELQQFNSSFDFRYEKITDIDTPSALCVPSLILQIPVENAIKHGLAHSTGKKTLTLKAIHKDNELILQVEDNGIGRKNAAMLTASTGTGKGLKLLLQTIYLLNTQNEKEISFMIKDKETEEKTGTIVLIKIPDNYNYQLLNQTI